jgi:chromosomal replication initiation ATPase DnaA
LNQLFFEFHQQSIYNIFYNKNFVITSENADCEQRLAIFLQQKTNYKSNLLIIKGPAQSGKTHLINHLIEKISIKNFEYVDFTMVDEYNIGSFFIKNHFYIVENYHRITNYTLLLHFINMANEVGAFLIFTANGNFNSLLPDLQSRLVSATNCEIAELSPFSAKLILINEMAFEQLKINQFVINFIINKTNINYQKLVDIIKFIKYFYQENSRAPKLEDIKNIIKS